MVVTVGDAVAFGRGDTTFGVSAKLYQSCLVMYDRADDSLYAQPWGEGIVGPAVNQTLERSGAAASGDNDPGRMAGSTPRQPKIFSTQTGHQRNSQGYPYGSYYTDDRIIFPVRDQEGRALHPKAIVSYLWEADGKMTLAGRSVIARWDESLSTVVVEELDGTVIPSTTAFAFVYPAFYGTP